MWTQRDQLQAYQFLRRRLVSALQTGDANHPVPPSCRLLAGYVVGAVCALLAVAGFGVYGVLRPGAGQQWRAAGQVVIEKETGARYVLMADGLLHPVLNYASARLLAGGDGRRTATVSARSLAGVPRGLPVGIPGAPDSLPAPGRLLSGPWTVCAGTTGDQPARQRPTTTAVLGVPVTGQPLGEQDAAIVSDPTGARYAVFDGRRWRLRDRAAEALGYDRIPPIPVTAAWLSAVPAGPDLALIAIDDSGAAGPQAGAVSTLVGQVLVADRVGGDRRYVVVRRDGLDAVTEIEAALILGNPANRAAYAGGAPRPVPVPAADIVVRPVPGQPAGYPERTPRPVPPAGHRLACAAGDSGERVGIWLAGSVPLPAGARPLPAPGAAAEARAADALFVPPGAGALVRDRQSPGAEIGPVYLITDRGVRYPLGGPDAVRALGFGHTPPTPVASTLLSLFPAGATLDTASAQLVMER